MKINKFIMMVLLLIVLTGCWDERLLKDIRTVYLSGFDIVDNDEYLISVVIRDLNIGESSRGQTSASSVMITGNGRNIRETSLNIDQAIAGNFDPAKGRTLILGEKVAENDLYDVFDSIFRESRINLNAKVVVASGTANELIKLLTEQEVEKAEYFYELITSREEVTEIPNETAQSLFNYLMDDGKDFMLPLVGIDEENQTTKIMGSALFHNRSFTGQYLTIEESTLLLLLMNSKDRTAILTNQFETGDFEKISYNVKKINRELHITKKDKVQVDIPLHLKIEIIDYPEDNLSNQKEVEQLEQKIATYLSKEANRVIGLLAENKSDVLEIGRELMAYYPEIWEEIKGENYYDQIIIHPEITVTITGKGIIL